MPTAAVAARKAGRNLGGRPRGSLGERIWRDAINVAVREVMEEKTSDGKVKKTKALRLLAKRLVRAGLEGDITALREIGDRLDGRAMQGIDLTMDVTITGIERHIIDATPAPTGIDQLEGEAVEVGQAVTDLLQKDEKLEPDAG